MTSRPITIVLIPLIFLSGVFVIRDVEAAAKPDVAALAAQLAQAKAEMTAASAEIASLKLAIAKLASAENRQTTLSSERATKDSAQRLSGAAQTAGAASAAEQAAIVANDNAIEARAEAKAQSEALLRASDAAKWGTYATLITQAFGFLALVAGFVWQFVRDSRAHEWSLQKIAEVKTAADGARNSAIDTQQTVAALEVNTNSKMDQLLKTTAAAEFAKGAKAEGERRDGDKTSVT